MFVCRQCRGQQLRLFSTTKIFNAEASPAESRFQDALSVLRDKHPNSRRRPVTARDSQRPGQGGSLQSAARMLERRRSLEMDSAKQEELDAKQQAITDKKDLERNMTRYWREGDIYTPRDLGGFEMAKWRTPQVKGKQSQDVCDTLRINPLDHYKNFSMMSEYITEMGRIKPRVETGLRPRNQRRMAKAIRRAVGCGLMSSVHKHPEILRIQMEKEAHYASVASSRGNQRHRG